MPQYTEHRCSFADSDQFDDFRRQTKKMKDGKEFGITYGISGKSGPKKVSLHYPREHWTASEAKKSCKKNKGRFTLAPKKSFKAVMQDFEGKNVVIYGKALKDISRDDVANMIKDAGGSVQAKIADDTNFIVYSDQLQLSNLQDLKKLGIVAIPFKDFLAKISTAAANPRLVQQVIDMLFRLEDLDSRDFENVLLKHGINFLDELEDWDTKELLALKKNVEKFLK